jgi:hypothetical protein
MALFRVRTSVGVFVSVAVTLAGACGGGPALLETPPYGDGGAIDGSLADGAPAQGVGQPCDAVVTCRAGLACNDGKCAPGHSSADGTPCTISGECQPTSYCDGEHKCSPAGNAKSGEPCKTDGDCSGGLRCNLVGVSAECQPEGSVDVGGSCARSADCFGGLSCVNKVCAPLPPGQSLPTPWNGVQCDADDPGATKVYFRVPRGSGDGDYFRFPFPNDVHMKSGRVDLATFPTPGTLLLGFDAIDRYLRYLEGTADGWSAFPTVVFRFSGPVNFDSLKLNGALRWVDVTPSGDGNDLGYGWYATTGRSAYVCENGLFIRPPAGEPLKPGHTYAVLIASNVTNQSGQPVARADDLSAVLGQSAPSDPALAAAYAAYAPLRTWAGAKSVNLDTIVGATVFTVGSSITNVGKLPAAVAAATAPAATSWVKCGSGPTPCPQAGGDRDCGAGSANFDEYNALVSLPVFQRGTAPYQNPDDGGDFEWNATTGQPVVQRYEQVCMSLTLPKGTPPVAGWPLVIYAHGTGGSFRSHITEGLADRLATAKTSTATTVPMAVLGIDQVEHGPRRGASTETPDKLFYNFTNPKAALGNPLQGAADQLSLVRFAKNLNLAAGSSPTGAALKFSSVGFWGHSQGATEGGISLPYSADIRGAVLSGEGASLVDALLGKQKPVNIAGALPIVLGDVSVGPTHPALAILQHAIDPADPLHHAHALVTTPPAGVKARSVFVPFGLSDSYAPVNSQIAFVIAGGLAMAAHSPGVTTPADVPGKTPLAVPLSGNTTVDGTTVTAAFRQYAPNGYDGHFVSFQNPTGKADVDRFLADLMSGVVPKVGP